MSVTVSRALKDLERLKADLEAMKLQEEAIRESLRPYLLISPYLIFNDEYTAELWPKGYRRGHKEEYTLTFQEVAELIEQQPADTLIHVYMGSCVEWWHIRTQILNDSYTVDQRQGFMSRDLIEHPELIQLYTTDYGFSVAALFLCLPDSVGFTREQYETLEIDTTAHYNLTQILKESAKKGLEQAKSL